MGHQNVLQGAHNFIIKDSNFYIAQNVCSVIMMVILKIVIRCLNKMEFHQHSSSGQDDVLPVPQKPNSSALFTGREDIIEKLKNHFAPQDQGDKQRKSFLLYGIGGIGKTQICLKFVEEMADRYLLLIYWLLKSLKSISRFFHVFWIDASSEDTITLSLKGLCFHPDAKAAISLSSVSSQSALAWISSLQTEWLLVFDNADGRPEVVEKFLPSGLTGNILVTSRNKSLGRVTTYENSLEVCQMSQNEATLLLLKASDLTRTSGNVNDVAQRIVNELCCLPLAVDQAGAAIEAGLCNIDNYLENLSQHRVRLMNHSLFKGASQYNRTVYETWDLSFCEIESRARRRTGSQDGEAAQVAILILQTAAFFHHENILEAMFREASTSFCPKYHTKLDKKVIRSITELLQLGENQSWSYIFFHEGIRVLRSFSLIKNGPSSGIYTIHPLMHKWNRDRMEMSQKQVMHKVAKLILVHSIPLGDATSDLAFRRILLLHIKTNYQFQQENHIKKEFDALEYVRYSHVLQENGMWKDAEDVQYQVMKITKKRFGEMHQSTVTSMGNLASTFVGQGKFDGAEKLLIQVLDLCTKLLGLEHPDTLTNMNNLAFTFSKQGNLEEAEKLNKQVLNLRTKLVGPEHSDTLVSMANLAFTFSAKGKYEEAEKLNMQVVNQRTKLLGPQHPNTLISMNDLAVNLSQQGKFEEAEKLNMQVLDLRRNLLGPEHPHTLDSMNMLALTFSKQRNFEEAEKLNKQVLNLRQKVEGPEHPNTLRNMNNLALNLSEQGKFEEAEKLNTQVLNLCTKLLGPQHPDTLVSMSNLAVNFLAQGKFEENEKLNLQVLNLRRKLLGTEHPDTLTSMSNLALTFSKQGNFDKAEKLNMQVLNLRTKLLGSEHPDTLVSMNNLAFTFSEQGKFEEAERLNMQVLNLHRKSLGPEHPDTLASMSSLALTFSKQGKFEKAERLNMQVLNLCQKLLGPEHPDTLASMNNLAITFSEQGKFEEAERLHFHLLNVHTHQSL
jgi:tetratricopeptide (TPR) repeat protein